MVERRIYDDESHAQFVTFSCYRRRPLYRPSQVKPKQRLQTPLTF